MARISSRMGKNRLIFAPYKSAQIKKIINDRLSKINIFPKICIEYISKKIASISSDIRRTLKICKMCVEDLVVYNNNLIDEQESWIEDQSEYEKLMADKFNWTKEQKKFIVNFETRMSKMSPEEKEKGPIVKRKETMTIPRIKETFDKAFASPINGYIRACSEVNKLALTMLYCELHYRHSKVVSTNNIFCRFYTQLGIKGMPKYSIQEMKMIFDKFAGVGIVSRKTNESNNLEEIQLNTNIDDLAFALRNSYDDFELLSAAAEQQAKGANAKNKPGRKKEPFYDTFAKDQKINIMNTAMGERQ